MHILQVKACTKTLFLAYFTPQGRQWRKRHVSCCVSACYPLFSPFLRLTSSVAPASSSIFSSQAFPVSAAHRKPVCGHDGPDGKARAASRIQCRCVGHQSVGDSAESGPRRCSCPNGWPGLLITKIIGI